MLYACFQPEDQLSRDQLFKGRCWFTHDSLVDGMWHICLLHSATNITLDGWRDGTPS